MYDCKLMEIRRAFFAGWMGCGALFFVVDGWEEGLSFLWKPSSLCWMAGRKVEFPVVKVRAGASSLCWMADWCVKVL